MSDNLPDATAPCIDPSIVGDLLIGEIFRWHVGFCVVKTPRDTADRLIILGENGNVVEEVDTDVWKTSTLFEDTKVKDTAKIADAINEAIASEYDEL
jgi:hypothetical protein